MPLIFEVIKSPVSTMCWAAWAWAESTSSSRGGEKRDANCTAAKMAAKSSQTASVEGACWGRLIVLVSVVIAEKAILLRIAAGFPHSETNCGLLWNSWNPRVFGLLRVAVLAPSNLFSERAARSCILTRETDLFLRRLFDKYAYLCCHRYWIELVQIEDC